jgi:hypothetical protein
MPDVFVNVQFPICLLCLGAVQADNRRDFPQVVVFATEFPNAAWAAHQIMNGRRSGELTPATRFGQQVYTNGYELIWSSGNTLLILAGTTERPAVTDDLVKAYLGARRT